MNISQPVPSAIGSVDFGFLSAEEIKSLSVKKIQNPTTFDTLLHPVPRGLYDPALGAWGDNQCATCHLDSISCPGHVGHIELPVPVYHPIFIDQLLRLLRAQCAYCRRLKLSRKLLNLYHCKLRLIQHGLIGAAKDVELIESLPERPEANNNDAASTDSDDNDGIDSVMKRRIAFVRSAIKESGQPSSDRRPKKNSAVAEARREVIKSFFNAIVKPKQCSSCNGISPTFRKDRYVKIFEKALTLKDQLKMSEKNLKITNSIKHLRRERKPTEKNAFDSDEGIADIDLSSNDDEEIEGDGDMLDVNGDVVISATLRTQSSQKSKPKVVSSPQRYVTSMEIRDSMTLLFENEQEMLSLVYDSRSPANKPTRVSSDRFFLQTLLVPPNKYRPEARTGNGEIAEAPQNSLYKMILTTCDTITQISRDLENPERATPIGLTRRRDHFDLQEAGVRLQECVNSLIDRDRNPIQGAAGKKNEDGIKQKLEKKEGLFRKNMMGKRVNFAARSVISPDPNIETNEIGVPPVFAKKLTYPEPVTSHNFQDLQQAVINGPDKWPGATAIENENGQVINLRTKNEDERRSLSNQLLSAFSSSTSGSRNKKVHRHLTNGDVVIMNRQPTLHKPSMMGHRARVLPGEKTIRMHYANCNTYNADFDGDEMNMHFPQSEVSRAEALQIADTDHQYLVATSGKPLRGLIQDHISVSVWLCNRDTYFDRAAYQQLIYNCIRPEENHILGDRILTVPPAIIKPKALWTGKQVITTVLKNIQPGNCAPLSLKGKSATSADLWGPGSQEGVVLFVDGEFITGILDKAQIGPSGGGLIHSIHEAYGPTIAGKLLSILGRLLTKFLHMRAFSCGIEDLLLTPQGEKARKETLVEASSIGLEVASKYVTLEDRKPSSTDPELQKRLSDVLRDDTKQAGLDMMMNKRSGKLSSAVTAACLPKGLQKLFPKNNMQIMTESGAKGSPVNANLISCNLGQQVLEGRRVPIMVSGKSLPCFKPFETDVRAGGYVLSRFLTGIRPQEYYFHAMAGREGLIDTAVKTSRSGYLQRCLIKGMEGLKVEYDTSVRDSDGSMVQFLYGEDGLDVTKQKHLTDFDFLIQNMNSILSQMRLNDISSIGDESKIIKKKMKSAIKAFKRGKFETADPVMAHYQPGRYLCATSEKFHLALGKYLDLHPEGITLPSGTYSKKTLERVLNVKYLKSVVEPGEAVGIVAGQSVGEPSTQMTLNTFHLAGHSAKNVTLGIPRLREIVMTASSHISTPAMTLRVIDEISDDDAQRFAKAISKLSLAEITDHASVTERIGKGVSRPQAKIYDIKLQFFPSVEYEESYAITVTDVINTLERKFASRLQSLMKRALGKRKGETSLNSSANTAAVPEIGKSVGVVEEVSGEAAAEREIEDDDENADGDDDATNDKQKSNRTQAVSYAANDEDDDAIQAQMEREASPEDVDITDDEGIGGSPREPLSDADDSGSNLKAKAASREDLVKSKYSDFTKFQFDEKNGEWCRMSLEYDSDIPKVLMLNILESALRTCLIQQIEGLESCTYVPDEKIKDRFTGVENTFRVVHTSGVNLEAMQTYSHVINPNTISTNDIAAMLEYYGVEACRSTIIQELSSVFGGHGIVVDNRHLNLIADFMTRGGGFSPFNRNGLRTDVNPFMKMSFETTLGFLKDAVLDGDWDDLENPSSRIVIGRTSKVGTGAFDVLTKVPVVG